MRTFLTFLVVATVFTPLSMAKTSYLTNANVEYPSIASTPLNSCLLCHTSANPFSNSARNSYGQDYDGANGNFSAIEGTDSDGDTFTNLEEITAFTFPGDADSFPVVTGTLKVKSPNGGETWTQGTRTVVKWSSTGDIGPDVRIELWQSGQKVRNLKGTTPNDGKQKVKVPASVAAGQGYSVKVVSISDTSISDTSNATFSIVAGP